MARARNPIIEAIQDEQPTDIAGLLDYIAELRASIPAEELDEIPADAAVNYKHYLYGHPKQEQ